MILQSINTQIYIVYNTRKKFDLLYVDNLYFVYFILCKTQIPLTFDLYTRSVKKINNNNKNNNKNMNIDIILYVHI